MFAYFVYKVLLLALDPAWVKVALHHLDWFQRSPSNKLGLLQHCLMKYVQVSQRGLTWANETK